MTKPGRNDPCPCGSGKKYKHCCERKVQAPLAKVNTAFIPGALQTAMQHHQYGQLPQAKALYKQILLADPKHADALHLLGLIEHHHGNRTKAIELIGQAIQARPADAIFHYNLGNIYQDIGDLDNAIACFRQSLLRQPDFVDAHHGLGTALRAQGLFDEAIATYRDALLLMPDHAVVRNNLIFTMYYTPTCLPADIFNELQRYAEHIEAPLKPLLQPHGNNRDPGRRLKVRYLSGDFRQHSVAFFIEPILACHDKSQVEVYGYYNHTVHDRYTERIVSHMDHWLVCKNLSDEQLAERIRDDGIDILIDLSGHTELNRLPLFARKPAPIQAIWIGYLDSSGLTAMDYRITDAWMDPPGMSERYHTETLVRLPGCMAYQSEPNTPEINALPALTANSFVFASLNRMDKINLAVVKLWSRILGALPHARLMLCDVVEGAIKQRLIGMFKQCGISAERLILQPRLAIGEYLAVHHQIDVGLDPFPYPGTTTTVHSLWMGVPVITLAGNNASSRSGVSMMSRVDLPGFVCQSEDEYLQCAIRWAQDLPGLDHIRQSLRQRMHGAYWNHADLTRQVEAAYRDMWHKWCAQ